MKKKRKNNTINVSFLVFVVLVISFFCIAGKLFLISLAKKIDGINLTEFVENRNTDTLVLHAGRGAIYSSDGETLAQNVNSYTVVAYLSPSRTKEEDNPHHVVDKEKTATLLSQILGMDKEYLLKLLNKDSYQVELGPNGRGISEIVKKQIEALDLPGIDFIETSKRYYTMGNFASYILGYADTNDDGDIVGKMGVEAYFDDKLQGSDGYTIYQKDAYGYTIPNTEPISVPAENGKDIYLTIDSKMQMFVENGIRKISSEHSMDWLTFSVVDANTGAVMASGSNPNFNPNYRDISVYLNPLTSYQYEPGSTMKIFSFLAAMENGIYEGDSKYHSGTIEVEDATIKDFNGHGWGTITYDEGFSYSSNVAATNLALKLGRDKLYNYYTSIGFGKRTGISLPAESNGRIDFNYRTELATASFGQGITTTPIQNLQALTILTNDGIELQPYIVDKIVDSKTGEVSYKHERTELGRKANSENVNKILSMMYDVVYSGKTDAKYYQADNVKLIGKTGTAQITGNNGEYMTGNYDYIRSFAGIFPYENPKYIIYVSVKRYDGAYKDFAKMVTSVVEEIAKYENIVEITEKIDSTKIINMNNYISDDIEAAVEKLKILNVNPIILGSGKTIIKQYPEKGKIILAGNKVFLLTNSNEYIMPDIKGWTNSDVTILCKLLNIRYSIDGYGNVKEVNIEPGTVLTGNEKLEVKLS